MIYTTYFAKVKKLPKHIVPVAISLSTPKDYCGLRYKALAPDWDTLRTWKANKDVELYKRMYWRTVKHLTPAQIVQELTALAGSNHIALVCYEKPGDFCHRHLIATWLTKAGYRVEEI